MNLRVDALLCQISISRSSENNLKSCTFFWPVADGTEMHFAAPSSDRLLQKTKKKQKMIKKNIPLRQRTLAIVFDVVSCLIDGLSGHAYLHWDEPFKY